MEKYVLKDDFEKLITFDSREHFKRKGNKFLNDMVTQNRPLQPK